VLAGTEATRLYGRALSPRRSVLSTLDDALRANGVADASERRCRVADIIDRVGLPAAAACPFPHESSGGQRQRVGLARALVLRPSVVVCDEPASSLDMSVRAQILNLLVELQSALELSMPFILHDLSVVKYIADRVLVMEAGRILDSGDHRELSRDPSDPLTRALIAAMPRPRFVLPS
jgi:peptide/nickel transport system ATP-binding protein